MLTACRTGGQWELAIQLLRPELQGILQRGEEGEVGVDDIMARRSVPFELDLGCFRAVISLLARLKTRRRSPRMRVWAWSRGSCQVAAAWRESLVLLEEMPRQGAEISSKAKGKARFLSAKAQA